MAFRISEDLYRKVRIRLAEQGMTLKGYVLGLIEADLFEDKQTNAESLVVEKDTMRQIHQQLLDCEQRFAEILDAKK